MKKNELHIVILALFLSLSQFTVAQEDGKPKALQEDVNTDDLGNVSDKFQEYFFDALAQKGIENYEKAIEALKKCRELNPDETAVYFELGKNYFALDRYAKAKTNYKKALNLKPKNKAVLTRLFDLYFETNNYQEAIRTAEKLTDYNANYYEDLANLYIQTEKYEEALSALDAIDDLRGQSSYREKLRRQIFEKTGDQSAQIEYLRGEIAKNPERTENYVNLMYVFNRQGNAKKARAVADQLQEENPDAEEAQLGYYKGYLEQENAEKAVNAMRRALNSNIDNAIKKEIIKDFTALTKRQPKFEPELVAVLDRESGPDQKSDRQLAEYYRQRDAKKALVYYKKALTENPNDFELIKPTLLLQIDNGKYQEALDLSSRAMAYYPSQPLIFLIQGVAHNGLGEFQAALASLETGMEFLVDDNQMQQDFYEQLALAHKELGHTAKSQEFKEKRKNLKK